MAQKQILPHNIRVDRNCQPTWVTQNAIPEEQELISLRGGHYDPLPDKVGLKDNLSTTLSCDIETFHYVSHQKMPQRQFFTPNPMVWTMDQCLLLTRCPKKTFFLEGIPCKIYLYLWYCWASMRVSLSKIWNFILDIKDILPNSLHSLSNGSTWET